MGVWQYCVFIVVFLKVASPLVLEQNSNVEEMFNTCQKQSNATNEEVEAFKNSQSIPSSTHGKCLLACIFQRTGVMTKEGRYNVDGVYELAKTSYTKTPEKLAKAKMVVEFCAKEVEKLTDKCEIAVKVANCTMVKSIDFGLQAT